MGLGNLLLIPGLGGGTSPPEPSCDFSDENNSFYIALLIEEF